MCDDRPLPEEVNYEDIGIPEVIGGPVMFNGRPLISQGEPVPTEIKIDTRDIPKFITVEWGSYSMTDRPPVYDGKPIEIKVGLPDGWNAEDDIEDYPCVMIIPCPKK